MIILSSLFSWPPQGHSTSSEKKPTICTAVFLKFVLAVVFHICHHRQSCMWKQVQCWMTLVAYSNLLRGTSGPDVLLCSSNANASVSQYTRAGMGCCSSNGCTPENESYQNYISVSSFFPQWVNTWNKRTVWPFWDANVYVLRLPLCSFLLSSDFHSTFLTGHFYLWRTKWLTLRKQQFLIWL